VIEAGDVPTCDNCGVDLSNRKFTVMNEGEVNQLTLCVTCMVEYEDGLDAIYGEDAYIDLENEMAGDLGRF